MKTIFGLTLSTFIAICYLSIYKVHSAEKPAENCGKFSDIQNVIIEKYGEQPLLSMIQHDGIQLILYANPQSSTWTVLSVDKENDYGCFIDSGTEFKVIEWKPQNDL